MTLVDETKIGAHGEILPKKQLRDALGFHPGDRVWLEVRGNELRVRKVLSIEEIFHQPPLARVTPEEVERELEEEGRLQAERSTR